MNIFICIYLILLPMILTSTAKAAADQRERLHNDLTPIGAIRAGNTDNSIPKWNADQYSAADYDKLLDDIQQEKPFLILDKHNYQQYSDLLSTGQIAMLERYPQTFTMPVYPKKPW